MTPPILPGATLGILGSGQLGRMFAIAARRLGYRVHVLSPDDDTPTGQVADREIRASYHDLDAVAKFAQGVSVVTFEFENVPLDTTAACERFAPVRPNGAVLHTTQNRIREKTFLKNAGFPLTDYAVVKDLAELTAATDRMGFPVVLKTADWGYDGRGQVKINARSEVESAWRFLATSSAVVESFVPFECEVSVIVARGIDGSSVTYGPFGNSHHNHILDVSVLPALVGAKVSSDTVDIARQIAERLDVVGVVCVEFFIGSEGSVLVNEIAPRPHNSGHLTVDACVTCQFEQQVRAVCGLPLGATRSKGPAAMANLLGDIWSPSEPAWEKLLAFPDVKLHLYGKAKPQKGRKMGHITLGADDVSTAQQRVRLAREALVSRTS